MAALVTMADQGRWLLRDDMMAAWGRWLLQRQRLHRWTTAACSRLTSGIEFASAKMIKPRASIQPVGILLVGKGVYTRIEFSLPTEPFVSLKTKRKGKEFIRYAIPVIHFLLLSLC